MNRKRNIKSTAKQNISRGMSMRVTTLNILNGAHTFRHHTEVKVLPITGHEGPEGE